MSKINAIKELMEYLDWALHAEEYGLKNVMELPSDDILNLALGLDELNYKN